MFRLSGSIRARWYRAPTDLCRITIFFGCLAVSGHDGIHWCQLTLKRLPHSHFTPPLNPLPAGGEGTLQEALRSIGWGSSGSIRFNKGFTLS